MTRVNKKSILLPVDHSKNCRMSDKQYRPLSDYQMPHLAAFDLGLHCLLRPVSQKLRKIVVNTVAHSE